MTGSRDTRYTRQTRLAEVGEAGQARLAERAIARATSGEAGAIEARYLEAAGARIADAEPSGAEHLLPFAVRDPAAREVARGAHAALVALRRVWIGGASS